MSEKNPENFPDWSTFCINHAQSLMSVNGVFKSGGQSKIYGLLFTGMSKRLNIACQHAAALRQIDKDVTRLNCRDFTSDGLADCQTFFSKSEKNLNK